MYLVAVCFSFFFFKQKTAYEMRISDWSSDVCSSDLTARQCHRDHRIATAARTRRCAAAVPLAPRAHATLARLATCRRRATAIAQRLAGALGYPRTAAATRWRQPATRHALPQRIDGTRPPRRRTPPPDRKSVVEGKSEAVRVVSG